MNRDSLLAWFPVILRYGGLLGALVFVPGVWVFTDRFEPVLIAMFSAMWGFGEGADAMREFARSAPKPPDLPTVSEEAGKP